MLIVLHSRVVNDACIAVVVRKGDRSSLELSWSQILQISLGIGEATRNFIIIFVFYTFLRKLVASEGAALEVELAKAPRREE